MSNLFYICSNKIDNMKNTLLLPNKYKGIGWVIFLLFAALGLACFFLEYKIPGFQLYDPKEEGFLDFNQYNLTNEFALLGITLGLLMVSFAKEKTEDEYILQLRLRSWQWSVLINYIILIILNFSVYGMSFLVVLMYNLWTTLIVFIIKFNWSLYKLRREGLGDEK